MHKKYCVKCKSTDNEFGRPYVTINGRGYYFCKPCRNEKAKRYYDKVKLEVFEHYGNRCNCCGEAEFLFLTIDHVDNNSYSHITSSGRKISGVRLYSHIKNNNFPKGYQLFCMNCNFGKSMNKGVCPHENIVVEYAYDN